MIGQSDIKRIFDNYQTLPKFMIFSGSKGCGRKTLASELTSKFNLNFVLIGIKMKDILSMIDIANNSSGNLFYIDNGNDLSINSENTLLKITEELPYNNYIILSTDNSSLLLPTIISRATCFNFQNYTNSEFKRYLEEKQLKTEDLDYIKIFPNLSYIQSQDDIERGKRLLELCNHIVENDVKTQGQYYRLFMRCNSYNLIQFLHCLQLIVYYKLLKFGQEFDKVNVTRFMILMDVLNIKKKDLAEGPTYNKNYIIDDLAFKFYEVLKCK